MTLAGAVRDGVRVRVDHERADGYRAERRLEPYRILSFERRWYLFAWDLEREDWRTFRLDRMHAVHASTLTFARRGTPDIEATVRGAVTHGPYPTGAVVRILCPLAQVAERVPGRTATLEADGEDACILRAGADDMQWVAMRLAALGEPIEVIEPPELLVAIGELRDWAASAR